MSNPLRVLVGFSVTIVAALTVGTALLASNWMLLRTNLNWLVGGFAVLGLLLFGLGAVRRDIREPSAAKKLNNLPSTEYHPLAFLKRLRYWGWIFLLSTVPLLIFLQVFCKPLPVAARPSPKSPEPVVVATPTPPEPAKWPGLELKGFICNGSRSTVVLNGRTLFIGERVDGVKVVAIEKWGVTVAFANEKRILKMSP